MNLYQSQFQYVSAPCGAGKTTAIINHIVQYPFQHNYLCVLPTELLMNQVQEAFKKQGINADRISSKTHPHSVIHEVVKYLKRPDNEGLVLIISWEAYKRIPFFSRRDNWKAFIDEIPAVDMCHQFTVPRNINKISEQIRIENTINADVARVVAIDQSRLKRELDLVLDDVEEHFKELFQHVVSENHDVFVDVDDWNRLVENHDFSGNDDRNQITFISMLNLSLFRNAVLLGANVEDSLIFDWLDRYHRVRLKPNQEITDQLRTYTRKSNCEINYFFEDRHFSKHLYKSTDDSGSTCLIDKMDQIVCDLFGDDEFLFVANNDRKSTVLDGLPNAARIPVLSHGSNEYRNYTSVYYSAATNRNPKHLRMLQNLGFSMDRIRKAESHEMIYQSIMRCALRNEECNEQIRIVVPDEYSAKRLQYLINGSHINKIGDLDFHKKISLEQNDRNRRCRSRKIINDILFPKKVQNTFSKEKCNHIGKLQINGNTGGQHQSWFVTTHKDIKAYEEDQFHKIEINLQDWIKHMRSLASYPVDRKEDLVLFCPSIFEPKSGTEGYKRQEHFSMASFLGLDFDGGDVGPDEFIRVFGSQDSTIGRHSFISCNSFSRSPKQPNRFRVMMFFKKQAKTVAEYNACFDYIERRLTKAGFASGTSGLDRNSRSPVQSYYIPATNREFPDHAFFDCHWTKTKELALYALDPQLLHCTQLAQPIYVSSKPPNDFGMSERAQSMKAELASLSEGRHHKQYLFALELRKLGATDMEVRQQLRECLGTEFRMLEKIEDTIDSLNKAGAIRAMVTSLAGINAIHAAY